MTAGQAPARQRQSVPPVVRLAVGVALILLAVVVFGGSRLIAGNQRHSYDKGSVPAATYHLTAGTTYQLSSPTGVSALKADGKLTDLACYSGGAADVQTPLTLVTTMDDDRDLRLFATFRAATTGDEHISCTGIDQVFVDDADDSVLDFAGLLTVVTVLLAFAGVILAVSGGYALTGAGAGSEGGTGGGAGSAGAANPGAVG